MNAKDKKVNETLRFAYLQQKTEDDTIIEEGGETDWSHGLSEINPDYAGWLTVDETEISLPVVYREEREYYLRKDFFGNPSIGGTCFLDWRTNMNDPGNKVIYGHYMPDGSMFGELKKFKEAEFFMRNGKIRFEDCTGEHTYTVFAVMNLPGSAAEPDYIDVQQVWGGNLTAQATADMLDTLRDQAYLWKPVENAPGAEYLYLLTCDLSRKNGRLLIAAQSENT